MFFLKKLKHTITLHPRFFGPEMEDFVKTKLYQDVEGTCTGRYGYVITVVEVIKISKGRLISGLGSAEFEVEYQAIVFKPFKYEVLDGIVKNVSKMGFFVDVGPLVVFVSSHAMPSDMKFDSTANPPCFQSDEQTIDKGALVRLKIMGLKMEPNDIRAIGTIKEDYLGMIGH
ncbi:DNA-directed RNA polymerase II subunit [Dimargaris cristalligena]|uniref:RNA polymerase Rpb7 n=1 Tax=Dimargaris cristalligena TaxID=215637 RepID=A0A4P9ZK04_9FUNG|nr:DNA-directed RNA polymerase II subunit [Dimargaris cristalligena]RKP33574.1 RNA polymerase Rpb7 [Dimargaris cristalligena]|eukprot:RKP33574.1 RNA polymerase Rpb7 [Dimargaris cristalligena]